MTTSQKFTEAKLEQAIIELLERQNYPYTRGNVLERSPSDVLIRCPETDNLQLMNTNLEANLNA